MLDFDAVAIKAQRLANDLDGRALRAIVTDVAVQAKKDVDGKVRRDLGSDGRMRNWSRIKFSSGFELDGMSKADLLPRPIGPWLVLERGRRQKPGAYPRGRRRRKVYRTPWGLRTATQANPWTSGSSHGHNTWTDAAKVIRRKTPERVEAATITAISKHFGRG